MRTHPFSQVDVFSPTPYRGNPVAVVFDAEDLDAETMQSVARWTNLSETTFVLPPTKPDADYRVRIFTPRGELPFAGHPTLGTAHAWLEHSGSHNDQVLQECAAGLVEVRRQEQVLSFAAPPTLRSGDIEAEYLEQIIVALGIDSSRVIDHQWVDNGPGWAVVKLATAAEVLALEPDFSKLPDAMVGAIGAHPEGSPYAYEMRTFAPGAGIAEDPICGSMNAGVAQWLVRTNRASGNYHVSQGSRVAAAGDITITATHDGTVWVGGSTTTLFQGTALI